MKQGMRRRISAITAIAIVLGSVCLFDAGSVQHADAKETLDSIREAVKDATTTGSYSILELVPDVATSTLTIKDYKDADKRIDSLIQSMGVIGYYVGGQEPSVKDAADQFVKHGLNDTALRKNYIEAVTEPIIDANVATTTETDETKPIYYSGYQEYCEGDYQLSEDVKAKIASGVYPLIPFDYDGTGASGEKHLDRVQGKMEPRISGDGKFAYRYYPTDNREEDYAVQFLKGDTVSSNNFSKVADATGEFDPHFSVAESGTSPEYYAEFGKMEGAKSGYIVTGAPEWPSVSDGNAGEIGMPVYKSNSGGVSENAAGAEFVYAGRVVDDSGTRKIKDRDGNDITGKGPFYMATFSYNETPGEGVAVYQVTDYDKDDSTIYKQYALNTDTPLVPNMACKGTVKVAPSTSWGEMTDANLIYEYMPDGGGNYAFTATPGDGVTLEYYCIRGAKIYYFSGYNNREWLKQYSFDRDAGEQCTALHIDVKTVPIQSTDPILTETDINGAKLFMLSNPDGALVRSGSTFIRYYGFSSSAGVNHDITGAQLLQVLGRVTQSKIPVIADYSIITDADGMSNAGNKATAQKALMYRFVKILSIEDVASYYASYSNVTEAQLRSDAADPEKEGNGTSISANEYHFVNKNVYVYNMKAPADNNPARVPFLNPYFHTEVFSEAAVSDGFAEVLLDIENENLYRATDGGRVPLSTSISEAVAIRYIIGYQWKRAYNTKGTMRILEIEPCASYDLATTYVDDKHDRLYLKTTNEELINQPETKIELTQMTTAEFIGKVEDLNAQYDLIYIGMNIGLMNTETVNGAKRTVYNDSSMNGLVYSNVGDYIYGQPVLAGLLDDDYINSDRGKNLKGRSYVSAGNTTSRYRYSGNDITKDKVRALNDYVEAGYPIMLADEFINTQTTGTTVTKTVNADRVDNASYVYEFVNGAKDKKNVFKLGNMSSALFNWYLNLAKPSINLFSKALSAQSQTQVIEQNSADGMYHTQYEFELVNKGAADSSSTFDCRLYVDINADGKFSSSTERLTNFVVRNADGSEAPKSGDRYQLTTGVRYYGSCILSEEYTGVLPWQIQVLQNGNDYRRMSAKGYYEIRNKKEDIKVLQINSNSGTTWDMEETSKNAGIFKTLLEDERVRFNVDIKTITSNDYNAAGTSLETYKEYLNQYDMLVLGFADCYRESNATAMAAVKEYIAEGKSVLFTHDTTSFINAPSGQFYAQEENGRTSNLRSDGTIYSKAIYWGYEFNRQIRNVVGMDRYGVLASSDQKEKAYAPKGGRGLTAREIQGLTYITLNMFRYGTNLVPGIPTRTNLAGIDTSNGQYARETVKQVNSGQITTYPYVLRDSFPVANTHGQYYQLDLSSDDDGDKESDIVVWYCINGTTDNKSNDLYKMSPNDVRNNYYIYNKGNITYCGVGHSKVLNKSGNSYVAVGSDEEIKLFINTMIAAYHSGLHAPKVKILENYKLNSREVDNIYISYDSQLSALENGGVLDVTEDFYFVANSVSLIQATANTEQRMEAKLYYEDAEGTEITIGDKKIKVSELPISSIMYYDTVTGTEVAGDPANLIGGAVYKVKIPTTILKSNMNTAQLYLTVTQTLHNKTTNKTSVVLGDDTASLVRVQMFNLE